MTVNRGSEDELTGLQNRVSFLRLANEVISRKEEKDLAAVYLRLLNLGAYNVRNGVVAGDEALLTLAKILLENVEASRLGRFSNGSFMALLPADQVETIVDDIMRELPTSSEVGGLTAKAGYCVIKDDLTVEAAMDRARYAFEDIRYDSPAWSRLFDKGLETAFERRAYVVDHLDDAIVRGEIRAFAQPIVRVMTGKICEVEVLARWESEQYGFLRPDEFVPELERTQMIHRMDAEVVRLACKQWAEAKAEGTNVPFGINLSRLDFELTDIFGVVTDAMATYGVPVDQVHIEVTESALAHSNSLLTAGIERFREAGFELYLDDFGSGYSSLRVLEGRHFDVVKLDMSLLQEVEDNERARVIVADAVSMVKRLALQTLCEGVETEEQYMFLKAVGCEKAQGYYFGKPSSHEEIMQELRWSVKDREGAEDTRYYDAVGRVNLMDGTRSNVQGIEAASFMATQPFAIAEVKGNDQVSFMAANAAFQRVIARADGISLTELERRLYDDYGDIRMKGLYAASKARQMGIPQQFDFLAFGSFCTVSVTFIEHSKGRSAYLVEVLSVTRYSQYNNFRTLESSMRFLYTIFKRIDLLDLTDNTWTNIYLNVPRYNAIQTDSTPAEEIEAFARTFIHPDDQRHFLEFYDLTTIDERLAQVATPYLADTFFTLSDTNRYDDQLFMIIPTDLYGHKQVLSCMKNHDVPTAGAAYQSGSARISDEVLLSGILKATDRCIFWKDEHRRFVGANSEFMEYNGLEDILEIRGKTDEELGWNRYNPRFKEDELDVLKGDSIVGAKGLVVHGDELRNIRITRRPLMNEGRVVGIIGYFTDTGRHVSYEEVVEEIRQQVLDRKYKVVTILGDPVVMEGGLLRTNIARSGVMVVEPGEREREWLGRRITRGFDDDQLEHFRDLILEARAHKVEAAVVCHPKIMETMETLALGLPILDASRVAVFV